MKRTLQTSAPDAPTHCNGWTAHGTYESAETQAQVFTKRGCHVMRSREDHEGKLRWHLSISCRHRYPHWDEIKDARYSLLPLDLTFAQMLPPPEHYTNIHPHCFHLWEIEHGEW